MAGARLQRSRAWRVENTPGTWHRVLRDEETTVRLYLAEGELTYLATLPPLPSPPHAGAWDMQGSEVAIAARCREISLVGPFPSCSLQRGDHQNAGHRCRKRCGRRAGAAGQAPAPGSCAGDQLQAPKGARCGVALQVGGCKQNLARLAAAAGLLVAALTSFRTFHPRRRACRCLAAAPPPLAVPPRGCRPWLPPRLPLAPLGLLTTSGGQRQHCVTSCAELCSRCAPPSPPTAVAPTQRASCASSPRNTLRAARFLPCAARSSATRPWCT